MPDGDAVPTVQLDLGYTDQVAVEAREVDGWSAEDDGEAIVWADAGGATTDPIELPVTITVGEGDEGDELFLPALQTCEDGSTFRWVATPGQDGDPAVKIELTSGEADTVEIDDDGHAMDDMDMDASEPEQDATAPTTSEATEATDQPSPVADAAEGADDEGSGTMVLVVAVVLALVLGGAVMFWKRGSA